MDRPTKFREISEAMRLSMPAEQPGRSDFSAKAEEGAHTTGSEGDSAAGQSDGHSPDEVRVRAYKQTRHGKTVPVRSHLRHHTPSQHEEEHSHDATEGDFTNATAASGSSDPKDRDANYSQGYSDAFHALMNGRDPASLSRDPNACPGYNQGVLAALKEIRQDPRWQKGFNDSLDGGVNPKSKEPYYLQGVRDHRRGDDAIGSMHDDSGDLLTFAVAAAYTTGLASAGIAAVAAMLNQAVTGAGLAASRLVQWVGNLLKTPALPEKITADTERADAERRAVNQQLVDVLNRIKHKIELGKDPAIKGVRPSEADTRSSLERYLGRQLSRAGKRVGDWVDTYGTTYDAISPIPSQHFDFQQVAAQIDDHLAKAHKVVINLRGLLPSDAT